MFDMLIFALEACACFYALTFVQNDVGARERRRDAIEQRQIQVEERDNRPIPPTVKSEEDWYLVGEE